jgi:cation transport ATPase
LDSGVAVKAAAKATTMSDPKHSSSVDTGGGAFRRYRVGRLAGEGVQPVRRGELHAGDEVVLREGDFVPGLGRIVAGRASVRLYSRSGTTPVQTVGPGAELPPGTEIVSGSLVVALESRRPEQDNESTTDTETEMEAETTDSRHERSALRLAATMIGSTFGVVAIALLGASSVLPIGIAGLCCGVMALGRHS